MMKISTPHLFATCDLEEANAIVESWAEPLDDEPAYTIIDVTALGDFFYNVDNESMVFFES